MRRARIMGSLSFNRFAVMANPGLSITGGELVSTGVVKQLGACRGVNPRKSLAIANITANDENYALAA